MLAERLEFIRDIGVLASLMVLVGKGQTWARWIVSPMLVFFGGSALLGGGIAGVVMAGVFLFSGVVFFRYRPEEVTPHHQPR